MTIPVTSKERTMEKVENIEPISKKSSFTLLGLFGGIAFGVACATCDCSMWWTPVLAIIGLSAGALGDHIAYIRRINKTIREPHHHNPRAPKRPPKPVYLPRNY